jgi:hypothetical protein
MTSKHNPIAALLLAMLSLGLVVSGASAQTAQGTINAQLNNKSGITIVFDSDPSGVTLGNAGTSSATLNFGAISAYAPLSAGVSRPSVTATNFTVSTPFDVHVVIGGANSAGYTLNASLAAPAATGVTYQVDTLTLTTAAQTVTANGPYNTDVLHNLNLVVSTAAPGAGGPATGTPIATTLNFVATAN